MAGTHVRLLQYNVGSHSHKGEVVKQQLVQTALEQGLCDLALVQGCTGMHEPLRSGTGAVYQPAGVQSNAASSGGGTKCQAGTLLCYTAEKYKVRRLSSIPEDLPGFVHSILLLQEVRTGTSFIAIVLASDTCTDSAPQNAPQMGKLWYLMKELSTQCPVLAAGECVLSSATDNFCNDASIHLHLCQPVHYVSSISQSFFAAACSAQHTIQISEVESLLARPPTASVQYTHNAHTAACCITCHDASAGSNPIDKSVTEGSSADCKGASHRLASSSSVRGSGIIAAKLRVLVNAASMGVAEACGIADAKQAQSHVETVHLAATSSSSSQACQQPSDRFGRSVRVSAPALLLISESTSSCQASDWEIQPKPATPAHAGLPGRHQLTQTSSGNLCFLSIPADGGIGDMRGHDNGPTTQPQTPEAFQLQPKPTGKQFVDISTLRIMQLQRSISELSASNAPLESTASRDSAAMSSELSAMLSQQRLHQQAPMASGTVAGRLSDGADIASTASQTQEDEQAGPEHSESSIDVQGDGLYAAAKQAPGELKAAWSKHVQQPSDRKSLRRQVKGRSSEDRMSSPGRLLKCLHSRTDSDVEAEMQTMQFKH